MKIIVISGKAGSGKDLTGEIIAGNLKSKGNNVLITHYADLLKYICRTYFHWNGQKDEYGRGLLQYVGTDVIRAKDSDFWVDFITRILNFFNDKWDYVIIPDCRFPNEIDKLIINGFDVTHIRVVRNNYVSGLPIEQQGHKSETALDAVVPDATLYNNGTISYLRDLINKLVEEIVCGN